jgi:putative cell wall-binding protein
MVHKSKNSSPGNWTAKVTRESDALDLEQGVFTWKDPRKIAQSLKNSADTSSRRKSPPFRSAMFMLVFYINRAGSKLDTDQKRILEQAKDELRKLYGKG